MVELKQHTQHNPASALFSLLFGQVVAIWPEPLLTACSVAVLGLWLCLYPHNWRKAVVPLLAGMIITLGWRAVWLRPTPAPFNWSGRATIAKSDIKGTTIVLPARRGEPNGHFSLLAPLPLKFSAGESAEMRLHCWAIPGHLTLLEQSERLRGQCRAEKLSSVEVTKPEAIRRAAVDWLNNHLKRLMPADEAALAGGFFLGKQTANIEIKQLLQKTGTSHLIAVSGYNFVVVAGALSAILGMIISGALLPLVLLLPLLVYAWLCGLAGSVLRALVFVAVAQAAKLFRRRPPGLWQFGLAMAIVLALNPFLPLTDVSFQLSALAAFGMIVVAPVLLRFLNRFSSRRAYRIFAQAGVETLAASIMVAPLLTALFGPPPLVSLPANLLVVPLVPVAMVLITGGLALSFLLPAANMGALLARPLPWLMLWILRGLA